MKSWRATIVLLLLLTPDVLLGRQLLHYEPAIVACRGTMKLVQFAGPPNYESINDGDKAQPVYILELDEAYDIASANAPTKPFSGSEGWGRNLKHIQVLGDDRLSRFVGKKVTARGRLSEAIFAHHHTSVIMEVLNVTGD